MLKRYVIEREVPGVGSKSRAELAEISAISNDALGQLAPHVQWEHSYVTGDKTFCIYLAEDEAAILAHAAKSGISATKITPVTGIISPTSASR